MAVVGRGSALADTRGVNVRPETRSPRFADLYPKKERERESPSGQGERQSHRKARNEQNTNCEMTPFRKDARLGLAGRRKRAPSACPGSLRLRQQIAGTERLRTPQTEQPTVRRSAAPPGLPGLKPRCRQGRVLPRAPSGESGLPPFLASGITRIPPPSKPAMALASPASHHSDADSPAPLLSQGPRGDTGPQEKPGPSLTSKAFD